MFSRMKVAAVSLSLGGFAAVCVGAAHADAAGSRGGCTRDARGSLACTYKSETDTTYTSKDGTVHVHQKQDCSTESRSRVEMPESGMGQRGTTQIGPVMGCSNHEPAPKDFTLPDFLR